MVTRPAVHRPTATVAELRAFFDDDHMHMALLVDDGELVGTVERFDLVNVDDRVPAHEIARLDGRTITPDASLTDALTATQRAGRRRLAVTNAGALLGLLCLKATGAGFCSDEDVAARHAISHAAR
jgi:CBS domain-containing protein